MPSGSRGASRTVRREVGAHDELTRGEHARGTAAQGRIRRRRVDGGVDVDGDFTNVVSRECFAGGDAGRHRVDAGSSPEESTKDTEGDHRRDDEDHADYESTVHLSGGARRNRR